MKQREPGEPGRPNGCQDCPSPKHRLLWTVPKDIVRLCEPQPGQLHLAPALKTRSSPNGSKAPLSREPKPARARGSRPREPFPAPDYPHP